MSDATLGFRERRRRPRGPLAAYDGAHLVPEEVLSGPRPMAEERSGMDRRPLLMIDLDGHTQQEVADEPGCYSVRSRTVSPVRAERRAASRISVTIMLFDRDESPPGSISPRTTPRRYGTADS